MNEVTLHTVTRDARICYEKGEAALILGNTDYALDMFEAALHIEPRLLEARRMLRNAAGDRRQPDADRLKRTRTSIRLILLSSQVTRKPLETIRIMESILKTDPANHRAVIMHSDAAVAAGMTDVAIQTLELFLEKNPRGTSAWTRLAGLYRAAGLAEKEYECWKQLAELDAGNADARKQLRQSAAQLAMNHNGWDRK